MNVRLKPNSNVADIAAKAAAIIAEAGGSPRAQITAARAASRQALVYMPHQGTREMERRARRLASQQG